MKSFNSLWLSDTTKHRDLGQHWIRFLACAWWYQAITWTNIYLSSVRFRAIHPGAISQEMFKIKVWKLLIWDYSIFWWVNSDEKYNIIIGNSFKTLPQVMFITFCINSLVPWKFEWNFRYLIFKFTFCNWWLRYLLCNCLQVIVTEPHWW